MRRTAWPAVAAGSLCLLLLPATVSGQEAGAEDSAAGGWSLWFDGTEEYRGRYSSRQGEPADTNLVEPVEPESDHDLRLYLAGGVASPAEEFRADLAAALWFDIDGISEQGQPTALASMYDYERLWWNFYRLSADWSPGGRIKLLRGGRQPAEYGLPVTFDGVTGKFGLLPRLEAYVFGGRTVHFFEADADLFEDWIGSAGLSWRFADDWRWEIGYRFQMQDVTAENQQGRESVTDHSVEFAAWYRRSDRVLSKLWFRTWNDKLADIGLRSSLFWPGRDMGIEWMMGAQAATLRQISEREDPYFAILGESRPYLRWRLDAWKGYDAHVAELAVHLGTDGKRLFESKDEGPFNRSAGRVYALFSADDIVINGVYAAVAVEWHFAGSGARLSSDNIVTVSGYAGFNCPKGLFAVELGTTYQQFKLDYYLDVRELENVRTVYLDGFVKVLDWLKLKLRYEYERADRDFHTVTVAAVQSF